EMSEAKKRAESLHAKNRRQIISGLEFVSNSENSDKVEGKGFVIINAKDNIKETIIGTIASILSYSSLYEEGTIIITMAHYNDNTEKIKISARTVGKNGRNIREILNTIIIQIGGEVGGHEFAAGAVINKEKEQDFINLLKKNLEIEVVKV
ncbi:DHH family phosphoesterase, partial [Candidatus Pacearchaeota archaeon]|nr:DHH family phosphoesterase [Candidatus Pacearchaeota archaeon]